MAKTEQKKPNFPNRPCPKCGQPIHIKSGKHEACGWGVEANGETKKTASKSSPKAVAKAEVNKSQAVREAISANPKAKVSEIVKLLADKGIKVSGNLVYAIKAKGKAKKRKAKREKAIAASQSAGTNNPVELIKDVRALADRAGGIRHLMELVQILAE